MTGGFREEQLYGSGEILRIIEERQSEVRVLAGILAGRAGVETYLLKRVAALVNNQALNLFLFILEMGPVSMLNIKNEFPSTTVHRYLPQLEAVEAVEHFNHRYRVKRIRDENP